MNRAYNFAAGPSMLPLCALTTAAVVLSNFRGSGMSVMEMSHRSKIYLEIFDETVALLRELMAIPDDYEVLLLQGGATGQFAAVPLNLAVRGSADYVDSGNFAAGAAKEAAKYTNVNVVASSKADNYTYIPAIDPAKLNPQADYLYITTNNTIFGTRYTNLPEAQVPLVADMSSNILSEVYDVTKFGAIIAGAQKNIGPAGVVVVIVRKDLLGNAQKITPKIMNWQLMAEANSMVNTPSTYPIYMAGLCLKWLKEQGGVAAIEKVNIEKAKLLYDYLDESRLFHPVAQKEFRSRMNVTFNTGDPDKDAAFVKAATAAGLLNLKGHRLVGGMRASIYNAMPIEGVKALVDFMKQYEAEVAHHV